MTISLDSSGREAQHLVSQARRRLCVSRPLWTIFPGVHSIRQCTVTHHNHTRRSPA